MLMGHPPPISARGRENASHGCFEGLTPVQVPIVVQELVACDAEVEKALADTLEAVQKIAQAGPNAFHRVAVHPGTVRVTTSILAGAMVDSPMVIVGLGKMVDVVFVCEKLRPAFHLGGNNGFDRRGAHILQHFEIDLCGWCVLVGLVTALHQTQQGWTTRLGGSPTAQLNAALPGGAFVAFDFPSQPFAPRTLVALIRFSLVLQLSGRLQMIRLVDAPIQQIDTSLCCSLLDVSSCSNLCGVQLQLPQANHQQPVEGPQLALLEDRTGPIRAHGKLLAQARGTAHTVEALQSVVAPFTRRDRIAATAWTFDAIGPAYLS